MSKKIWGVILIFLLLVAVWLGLNRWPIAMEAPLWTQEDLSSPATGQPGSNAYEILLSLELDGEPMADLGRFPETSGLTEFSSTLTEMDFYPSVPQALVVWQKITPMAAPLSDYLQSYRAGWAQYQKVLQADPFIDQEDVTTLEKAASPWLDLAKLHRLAVLNIIDLALQGRVDAAYQAWLQMFRLDISHGLSARSALSHKVACKNLFQDLALISLLRVVPPSPQIQREVIQILQGFDPEKLLSKRVLMSEYLLSLAAGDALLKDKSINQGWLQWVFNPARYRRDTNAYFRSLTQFIKDPTVRNEQNLDLFNQQVGDDLELGAFWWFYDPAGKVLRRMMTSNLATYTFQFEGEKEELAKMRQDLLSGQLFASPSQDL